MLERWKGSLGLSNRSVAKYLVILHGIFKRAMRVWGAPRNPVVDVERPRYRVSDDLDAYSPEEVWALLRAAGSEQDAALFLTAAFTGLRMGELLALQWRDVDFVGESIRVRHSYNIHGGLGTPKSGKVRSVPLVPDVAKALAGLGQRTEFVADDELVFPNELGRFMDASALRDRYKAARTRAGLRPLRFHDRRHTFGTRCAMSTTATVAARPSFWLKRSPWPACPPRRRRPRRERPMGQRRSRSSSRT